jgi:hypothetical protein
LKIAGEIGLTRRSAIHPDAQCNPCMGPMVGVIGFEKRVD